MQGLHIEIQNYLGNEDLSLSLHVNKGVSLIHDVNGTGKSMLLKTIHAAFEKDFDFSRSIPGETVCVKWSNGKIVEQNERPSIFIEPIAKRDSTTEVERLFARIIEKPEIWSKSSECINSFLGRECFFSTEKQLHFPFLTKKSIHFGPSKVSIFNSDKASLSLDVMSSGELLLLRILLSAFLQPEKEESQLILDSPDLLHMDWQERLITTLTDYRPKMQLIIAAQNPAFLADGWSEKAQMLSSSLSNK